MCACGVGGEGVSWGPQPTGLLPPPLTLENPQQLRSGPQLHPCGGSRGLACPWGSGSEEPRPGIGSHSPCPQDGALHLDAQGKGCRALARPLHCLLLSQGSHLGGPVPRWAFRSGAARGPEQGRGLALVTPAVSPDRSTMVVLVPTCYEWFEEWQEKAEGKRNSDCETLKNSFVEASMSVVMRLFPQLEGKVGGQTMW